MKSTGCCKLPHPIKFCPNWKHTIASFILFPFLPCKLEMPKLTPHGYDQKCETNSNYVIRKSYTLIEARLRGCILSTLPCYYYCSLF